jgi:hypothetical protein
MDQWRSSRWIVRSCAWLAVTIAMLVPPIVVTAGGTSCERLASLALPNAVISLARVVPAEGFTPPASGRLAAGYAGVSTDTGHVGGSAQFALGHPEKLNDLAFRSQHEMTVKAKATAAASP